MPNTVKIALAAKPAKGAPTVTINQQNGALCITSPNGTTASVKPAGKRPTAHEWQVVGAHAYVAANTVPGSAISVEGIDAIAIGHIAAGAQIKSWRFDKYKTVSKKAPGIKSLTLITSQLAAAQKQLATAEAIAEGVAFCRDMGEAPPNDLYPETAAAMCKQLAKAGVKLTVYDEKQINKMGLGCIEAVGQASKFPSRFVVLEYYGAGKANKKAPLIAMAGKGVTYDTGGINLKPEVDPYSYMKYDMMGGAAVLGALLTLAKRKAKANVVAAVGFVENAIGAGAYRPFDIITSLSGKTVEIWNTDAEGRLVIADCMTYLQRTFKPSILLDCGSLTGNTRQIFGLEYAAMMGPDDELANQMHAASHESGDRMWRLPCGPEYDQFLTSHVADLRNVSSQGKFAGTITCGRFLSHFVEPGVRWLHLDISSCKQAMSEWALGPVGATGFGVRLLDRFIADNYESE